jgi:hypothetical protein
MHGWIEGRPALSIRRHAISILLTSRNRRSMASLTSWRAVSRRPPTRLAPATGVTGDRHVCKMKQLRGRAV